MLFPTPLKTMQHLRIISFVVLVAGCVFHAEGFPIQNKQPPSPGYFEYAKSIASRGAELVGNGITSDYAKNLASSGATLVGSGLLKGAELVKTGITSDYAKSLASSGAQMVGTGLVSGAELVGNGLKSDYAKNLALRGAEMVAGGPPSDYSKNLAARGAELLGSGLVSGAHMVKTGITSDYAKSLASSGAEVFGNGLVSGAGLVGIGLKSDYTKNLASRGADMVGSGLHAGAEMIAKAEASQFTVDRLSKALSSVNPQSLATALGMPDLPKAITDKVDLSGILQKVFIGQSQSGKGGMNYETATIFLQRVAVMVPSLKKTIEAFKTVNYVMNKARKLKKEGKPIDAKVLMSEAIDVYFMDVDPAFKEKLISLSPLVSAAAFGDKDAAWKVAAALGDRNTVIQALKGMGYKAQIEVIQNVIGQVSKYATLVKADAAGQK